MMTLMAQMQPMAETFLSVIAWWAQLVATAFNNLLDFHYW